MRMTFRCAILACWGVALAARAGELAVDTNFPGGAAEVVRIDQADRRITYKIPAPENGGWQAWWYFKVSGITPGETVKLELLNGQSLAARAVYSTDQKTWRFTQPIPKDPKTTRGATYEQKLDAPEAWLAWYVPYLQGNVSTPAASKLPFCEVFELCKSEEGRQVIGYRFQEGDAKDRPGVWVQARQHAWETGGSWVAQGLVNWLTSDDERARNLRRTARITVIPIVDVDSVENGRGGKDQKPHDHNRDWGDQPRWDAVKAAMSQLKELDAAGELDLFIDLHDPGWNGQVEFWCHTYPTMAPPRRHNTDLFLAAGKSEITGPLTFNGKAVATYALTTPTSGIWASSKTRDKVVGGTFEIGVAPPKGFDDAPPGHHLTCGKQIGLAIERYLRENDRKRD
jgi:hypothetical protein